MAGATTEPETAWEGSTRYVARLRSCSMASMASQAKCGLVCGSYAISGGLGGLGRRAATLLLEHGATRLVLASRSGRASASSTALPRHAHVVACDLDDCADAQAMMQCFPLSGILHAAGVLRDSMAVSVVGQHVQYVCGAKAVGASHLHACSATLPLEAAVFFSSITAPMGNSDRRYMPPQMRTDRALLADGSAAPWNEYSDPGRERRRHGRVDIQRRGA